VTEIVVYMSWIHLQPVMHTAVIPSVKASSIAVGAHDRDMRPCNATDRTGKTLIEIVVVVAIILVLMALIVTGVSTVRRRALLQKTSQHMAQLLTAFEMLGTSIGSGPCAVQQHLRAFTGSDDSGVVFFDP
jgi:hypothetical protein